MNENDNNSLDRLDFPHSGFALNSCIPSIVYAPASGRIMCASTIYDY